MNRGQIGVLPRPKTLADESYLEFVTSFRRLAIQDMFPKVAEHGEIALAEAIEKGEVEKLREDETIPLGEIKRIFARTPVTPTFQRFVRSQPVPRTARPRSRSSCGRSSRSRPSIR